MRPCGQKSESTSKVTPCSSAQTRKVGMASQEITTTSTPRSRQVGTARARSSTSPEHTGVNAKGTNTTSTARPRKSASETCPPKAAGAVNSGAYCPGVTSTLLPGCCPPEPAGPATPSCLRPAGPGRSRPGPVPAAPGSTPAARRGQPEPTPVLGRGDRAGAVQPGRTGRLVHLGSRHMVLPPRLRGQHPDQPAVVQRGQRIQKQVREVLHITVIGAPPHQNCVDHVIEVFIGKLIAGGFLQGISQSGIGVVVETELLDDLPLLHSKTDAHVVIRGVRGRCHVCPLFRYARQVAHMWLLPHRTRRGSRNPTHARLVVEVTDRHFHNLERHCHGSHTAKNMTHA